jgi:hypothetical protein
MSSPRRPGAVAAPREAVERSRVSTLLGAGFRAISEKIAAPSPMPEPSDDYYAILGVSPTAPPAAIRAAFHRIAWECHPDRQGAEELQERFIRAAAAFRVISDPRRRASYDRERGLKAVPLRRRPPVRRPRRRRVTTIVLICLVVLLPMLVSWVDVKNYLMATYALALLFVVVLARLSRDL